MDAVGFNPFAGLAIQPGRRCNYCHRLRAPEEFRPRRPGGTTTRERCRQCEADYMAARRELPAVAARIQEHYRKNAERLRAKALARYYRLKQEREAAYGVGQEGNAHALPPMVAAPARLEPGVLEEGTAGTQEGDPK